MEIIIRIYILMAIRSRLIMSAYVVMPFHEFAIYKLQNYFVIMLPGNQYKIVYDSFNTDYNLLLFQMQQTDL